MATTAPSDAEQAEPFTPTPRHLFARWLYQNGHLGEFPPAILTLDHVRVSWPAALASLPPSLQWMRALLTECYPTEVTGSTVTCNCPDSAATGRLLSYADLISTELSRALDQPLRFMVRTGQVPLPPKTTRRKAKGVVG